ncbi:HlyD family secretion protein [Cupriavidus consociatus]|uniref:HlyD family secretion protein n=1 Tax=Cupriavidus consociatus TaxID=2821357 RepID=UPI001AEA9A8E|nr:MULTISPECIES: HlyD family efflux transporter periplasmic adaptor subunit [unclassified Cupriavidus]MBP0620087.1 HlyD family efflux transporter periplasmic adaptor subunit [Cupriavidus sp. LEh25]MDK2656742.1 HlyD family efflux transporter periplasmic adaptor subunit [Cupriavidus sp. LEh21]
MNTAVPTAAFPLPALPRALPIAALLGAALLAAGCSKSGTDSWQGYIEGEFVSVASPFAGRLDTLSVQRGQQVAQGAALFVLESDDERAARQQAEDQLRAAEAQLQDMKTGKRPVEVDVSRAQLAQAQAQAQRSAAALRRDERQFEIGGIAQAQLDESRAQARSDAARVRELQRDIDVARLPGRDAQQAAQAAQVAAARAALAQADWKLSRKTVAATQAGLVYDTPYRLGEWVPAGSPVVRMLPPGNVKVRFYVPEAVVGALRNGQAVQVRCDGCAAPVAASITYVANEAEFTPPVIYSNETRNKLVFLVEARPSAADAVKLRPGQPVEVVRQ